MKNFSKIYLGKGKKITNLRIVKITLKLDDLKAIAYDFEGVAYVSFEVAQMIQPDQFGRTHTCYYRKAIPEKSPDLGKSRLGKTPSTPLQEAF